MLGAPHRHNPLTLLRFAAPAAPAMPATVTSTPRPHVCYYSRHGVSRSMPINLPHMVYLLDRHRCLVCVHPSQSRPLQPNVSTTQVGTHPVRSATTTYKRSASTVLGGTHNPVGADPRARTGPFPKRRALVLPMVKFGQSKPDGLGHIDTADSDLMHHQYRLFVLQWTQAQRAETPPQRLADGFMRLFFKKPVTMSRTSLISSLHTLVTRTLLSHPTRTPSSPTLWVFALGHGATHRSITAAPLLTCRDTNGHILLSTHPQCRGQET